MSYTMTMEPDVRREAEAYAARRGMTLECIINAYLIALVRQEPKGERLVSRLHDLMARTPKLNGAPYRFTRQDAYEEELA